MDKLILINKIKSLEGLTNDEKADLIHLLNETKQYGLIWEDKPEEVEKELLTKLPVLREVTERRILAKDIVQDTALQPSKILVNQTLFTHTEDSLEPTIEDSNHIVPNHILIEGDNLHALTALTFTHEDKIDVIYIDPPYNTGNKDFKYNDSFVDKEDSYRHSKWLSFMYKRLQIAKRLLSKKGVIFISIDDNENAQLKLLCDEIFNEQNLISDVIWQSRKSVSNDTFVSLNHNYTLIYAKDINYINKENFRLPTVSEKFSNSDNDPRGPWVADPFDAPNLRPNLTYAIFNPNNGKEYWPPRGRCWRTTKEEYSKFLEEKRIVFGKTGKSKPQLKRFLDFAREKGSTPISIWNDIETTTNGTQQLELIFGRKVFTNPKPLGLLNRILILASSSRSIILDFFAGSGTTLHATMQLNTEDNGTRQCILITNNENKIAEDVCYERNKRIIMGYSNAKGLLVSGLKRNNLRYYKTDFVSKERTIKIKKQLTLLATEMLCIKEDIYCEQISLLEFNFSQQTIRCFVENEKYLFIVYDEEYIEMLVPLIYQINSPFKIKVYVFSPGQYPFTEEFEDIINKVDVCALPDAIYKAYMNVLPIKSDRRFSELFNTESTDNGKSNETEADLFIENNPMQ